MGERILIFSDHISTSSIVGRNVSGRTTKVSCAVKGRMDEKTSMVLDFDILKEWFRDTLNDIFDHGAFVMEGHPVIALMKKYGLRYTPVSDDAHEGIRMAGVIENNLRQTIPAGLTLEGVEIENPYPKGEGFEHILNFSHSLRDLKKCNNIHGHSWMFRILNGGINNPMKSRVRETLSKSWNNKLVLHEEDPLLHEIENCGIDVKVLKNPPTTEVLVEMMAEEAMGILGSPIIGHRRYALRETPSQEVQFMAS